MDGLIVDQLINIDEAWSCDTAVNGFTATSAYILGPANEQMTELTVDPDTTHWKHTNVYAAGQLIATYDATPSGMQALHFHFADWLGTRRTQTDYAGNVEEYCSSLPFGDFLNCITPSVAPSTADDATEHHFTEQQRDTESGLDYFEARYLNSSMGRWMSPDWSAKAEPVPYAKMNNPQSLNLYDYVSNNPLSRADADGHCYPWCTALIGAGIGAAAEFTHEAIQGKGFDEAKIAAAAGGAVIGIVGPAGAAAGLGTAGTIGSAVYGAVLGGATERVVSGALSGKQDTPNPLQIKEVAKDAVEGAVGSGIGKATGTIASPVIKTVVEAIGNVAVDTARRNNDTKQHSSPAPPKNPRAAQEKEERDEGTATHTPHPY